MLLVFALGLIMAVIARPFESHLERSGSLQLIPMHEPYQDLVVLLTFTGATIGIMLAVSGWSLRHLEAASREAGRVGPRNPHARIKTQRLPREIRPMVAAVNAALDRMAQAYDTERRFVVDAAHELRTPLTVLSLRLQQARLSGEPDWGQIEKDLAQIGRVVSQLLDLARKEVADQNEVGCVDVVNVGRAVREAAAFVLPLADAAGRSVEVDLPERLPVCGRVSDLKDMFRNLLENALLHGRRTIRVMGRLSRCGEGTLHVAITVSDQGTGLASTDRELLFDRFRKADAASSGSGIGLAIVREVVRGHGGTVRFLPGRETTVEVLLPAGID